VAWQARHGWPQLTVAAGISEQEGGQNRILFVPMLLIALSPVLVPVWLTGMVRLWRDPELRWARAIAVACPVLWVALLVLGGKFYYGLPPQLLLLAAGAQPAVDRLRRSRVTPVAVATVPAVAISLAVALPALPPGELAPLVLAVNKDAGEQVGWPALADTVARVWREIPVEQRDIAVILTWNYGQAGAIELYGPALGLPKPYSGHMSYADWGPPPDAMTGPVVLVGGVENDPAARRALGGCRTVARNDNGVGLDNEEQGIPVQLCGSGARPWSVVWPSLRHFY
jgi:hypothetical protein